MPGWEFKDCHIPLYVLLQHLTLFNDFFFLEIKPTKHYMEYNPIIINYVNKINK